MLIEQFKNYIKWNALNNSETVMFKSQDLHLLPNLTF